MEGLNLRVSCALQLPGANAQVRGAVLPVPDPSKRRKIVTSQEITFPYVLSSNAQFGNKDNKELLFDAIQLRSRYSINKISVCPVQIDSPQWKMLFRLIFWLQMTLLLTA